MFLLGAYFGRVDHYLGLMVTDIVQSKHLVFEIVGQITWDSSTGILTQQNADYGDLNMASEAFKKAFHNLYLEEVGGEAMTNRMLKNAQTPEQRWQCSCLLQLETEGKMMMRPTLIKWGMSIYEPQDLKVKNEELADRAANESEGWIEQWKISNAYVENEVMELYEGLVKLVKEEEDPEAYRVASFMGCHERRLLEMGKNIVNGKKNPEEPVWDFLFKKLPKPSL